MVPILRHPAPVHVARGAGRVRGILDNFQIVVARDFEDPIDVASLAAKCTGRIARTRLLAPLSSASSMRAGLMLKVPGSTSTNTGRAPR